ncbi:MAG: phosphoribosylglycinamide formyltransferase [Candidatus Puniceispirillum sp.]|uniref:phosphoribosylglycinamide formyltransferase n=1 Tax=Candidatus Puniceispirillum sp. TaxID=2026719 RepID=UPI001EC76CFC|nr:phosphoribosylglycinamide formyltransferase [Candidatus Puniceispirillum sp.]MBT6415025.1 phosphoribosylglycinamide formyltransferase [Candidatus Puniceispirillum sp.]MBT6566612.1 phosphoribosylglycinamide formyltransferase [Candidatus Puniceispirillum sp.]
MTRVAILISGRGSNMQALVDDIVAKAHSSVCLVAANTPCVGIDSAAAQGIPTKIVNRLDFASREDHDLAMCAVLDDVAPDYIFMAGYMALIGTTFVTRFAPRILNIHPSLLPAYKGLHTHERALADGVKQHGVTVHIVSERLDDGPTILQAALDIKSADTATTLAARVLVLEHLLYPFVLSSLAHGDLEITRSDVIWHARQSALNRLAPSKRAQLEASLIWP